MVVPVLLLLALRSSIGSQNQKTAIESASTPITLNHIYFTGQTSQYRIRAKLHIEERNANLLTFMPSNNIFKYDFYLRTLNVEAGNGTIRYYRPSISQLVDDGSSIDPKPHVTKLKMKADLVMSPINAILDDTDLSKKSAPKKKKSPIHSNQPLFVLSKNMSYRQDGLNPLLGFVQQVELLAVYIGGPGSSLDFAPQFSLYPVKVGDTWKQTVGYQPQNLAEGAGKQKSVVQRLDLIYTYRGDSTYRGKPVRLVTATIDLKTDLAKFVEDQFRESESVSHLKSFPLHLHEEMSFYLNPKTDQTIAADVHSTGGFKILTTFSPNPVEEMKLRGKNHMYLLSNSIEKSRKK